MDRIDSLKKKLKKTFEKSATVDPDSDFPVHEKFTRQKDVLSAKKKNN